MSAFSLATLYLPEWALPWVAVFAVAAFIVGARGLGTAAVVLLLAELVLAPLLEPWLMIAPDWALVLFLGVLALSVEYDVIALLFNREVANEVVGGQLRGLISFVLIGPFRLLGRLMRLWRPRA